MPNVRMPDGVIVQFPDDMPAEQIKSLIATKFPEAVQKQEPAPDVSTAEDVGRSGLAGVRQGFEGMAGTVGDINQRQADLASWAAGKLGAGPEMQGTIGRIARRISFMPFAPTTDEIQQNYTNKVAGESYKPQTTAGEYARTVGQFAPGVIGGEGSLATRAVTQAVIPGLASEAAGQATKGTAYEPFARAAGGLAGGLLPAAAKSVVSPFKVDPQREAMAASLKREGVDLTAGQVTGSEKLRYMESELGGMAGQRIMEKQAEQFTKAALKRAGIDAERATPETIHTAFKTIGSKFDDLASRNNIIPDKKLGQDLKAAYTDYASITPPSQHAPIIRDLITDIAEAAKKGQISGDFYQRTSSIISRKMRQTQIPEVKAALDDTKAALDDAMERSIARTNKTDLGAWRQVRKEYRNLMVIEKAATGAGENAALGLISPSQLRNATVQQGRRAYARGQGDFAELARAGESMMKPLPNSGTASRTAARNFFSTAPTMLGGGVGYAAGLPGMIAGAAVGSALPFTLGRFIMSPQGKALILNQAGRNIPAISVPEAALRAGLLSNLGR